MSDDRYIEHEIIVETDAKSLEKRRQEGHCSRIHGILG